MNPTPPLIAIIGGTGLTNLASLEITRREMVSTPFGEPSGPVTHGRLNGHAVAFLPRHGAHHTIPPHRVNYRANIWALSHIGVQKIIAVAAVGGIHQRLAPASLALPDQIIDYTYGRAHTFHEEDLNEVVHVDFTYPYCQTLREQLHQAATTAGVEVEYGGTYGATQGPRLETAAEICRLAHDGCDMVGMTGMPETVLAREAGLSYACCAVVANWGAGIVADEVITMESVQQQLLLGMDKVKTLLHHAIPLIAEAPSAAAPKP